jgi:glycosyltransferase involved in cell wall biosynthesis
VFVRKTLGIKPSELLCCSAGRLGHEKNFGLVLEAFRLVADKVKGAKLVLLGDGPERTSLEARARALGLKDQVLFRGMVPRQTVIDTLAASDLFVFGSVSETQGMVLLEALSQGTPAVAVDALGPGDLLKGDRGGLLAKPEPASLADKVLKLAKDRRLRAEKARQALKRAGELSAKAMTKKLVGYYEETIRNYR